MEDKYIIKPNDKYTLLSNTGTSDLKKVNKDFIKQNESENEKTGVSVI
jgi:hypothetical protein